jgi:hypothetical protein
MAEIISFWFDSMQYLKNGEFFFLRIFWLYKKSRLKILYLVEVPQFSFWIKFLQYFRKLTHLNTLKVW